MAKIDFTAWFVLQGLVATIHRPEFGANKDASLLDLRLMLARAAAKQRFLSHVVHHLPFSWQYKIGQLVTDEQRLMHFYLRKQAINAQVHEILASGSIQQMVILGSGLDVLPLSIANLFPHVRFIEVDLEPTQNFKKEVLASNHVAIPSNLEMVCGDLRHSLGEVLKPAQLFHKDTPTLWLAEGLLMFLSEETIVRLFQEIRGFGIAHSQLIFTTLTPLLHGTENKVQKLYLKKEKTPFKWQILPDDIAQFLSPLGYILKHQISYDTLHAGYAYASTRRTPVKESISIAILNRQFLPK